MPVFGGSQPTEGRQEDRRPTQGVEETLAATQEAVGPYRKLAQASPQAFLPDLATSLGAYGTALMRAERYAEAADAFEEGCAPWLPSTAVCPRPLPG